MPSESISHPYHSTVFDISGRPPTSKVNCQYKYCIVYLEVYLKLARKEKACAKYRLPNSKQLSGIIQEQQEDISRAVNFFTCLPLNRRVILCFCCSLVRRQKSLSEVKPHSTAHAATFKTGDRKRINRLPCDVAFLAHPASLLSALAFWLPEDRPMERCGCLTATGSYDSHALGAPCSVFLGLSPLPCA